jgi:hypothetical protein
LDVPRTKGFAVPLRVWTGLFALILPLALLALALYAVFLASLYDLRFLTIV